MSFESVETLKQASKMSVRNPSGSLECGTVRDSTPPILVHVSKTRRPPEIRHRPYPPIGPVTSRTPSSIDFPIHPWTLSTPSSESVIPRPRPRRPWSSPLIFSWVVPSYRRSRNPWIPTVKTHPVTPPFLSYLSPCLESSVTVRDRVPLNGRPLGRVLLTRVQRVRNLRHVFRRWAPETARRSSREARVLVYYPYPKYIPSIVSVTPLTRPLFAHSHRSIQVPSKHPPSPTGHHGRELYLLRPLVPTPLLRLETVPCGPLRSSDHSIGTGHLFTFIFRFRSQSPVLPLIFYPHE